MVLSRCSITRGNRGVEEKAFERIVRMTGKAVQTEVSKAVKAEVGKVVKT